MTNPKPPKTWTIYRGPAKDISKDGDWMAMLHMIEIGKTKNVEIVVREIK